MLKLISLTQPWASLVTAGLKRFETRCWNTPYRGDLAIHATKARVDQRALHRIASVLPEIMDLPMPLGAVLSVVTLTSCTTMTPALVAGVDERELVVGDWQLGRFALELTDLRSLSRPLNISTGSRGRPIALAADLEVDIRSLL